MGLIIAGGPNDESGSKKPMTEIHFLVEEAPEGGYLARAIGSDIFTEADDVAELRLQVRDAVRCHFDASEMPGVIRLHFTREEVIAA